MNQQKSATIAVGMRSSFRDGTSKLASRVCYGYECDEHGNIVVFVPEAMVALQIFNLYLDGASLGQIADCLAERETSSPSGRPRWNRETQSAAQLFSRFI